MLQYESHPGVLCWVSLRGGGVDSQPRVQAAHLGHVQQARPVPNGHVAPGCICNLPLHRKRISGVMCSSLLISRACVWISEITALGPSTAQFVEITFFFFNTHVLLCTSRCHNTAFLFFFTCRFIMCLSPLSWCRTVAWRGPNPGLRVITALFAPNPITVIVWLTGYFKKICFVRTLLGHWYFTDPQVVLF